MFEKTTNTAKRTAQRLRDDLSSFHGRLPPMRELARQYRVSLSSMCAAARRLRDEGVLEYAQGKRARVVEPGAFPTDKRCALDKILDDFERELSSARLQTGMPVGKTATLARTYGASQSTVVKALLMLSDRGLIHKEGRFWLAGPSPKPPRIHSGAPNKVILLIQDHPRSWESMSYSARTARFCHQFSMEAERFGVGIISAFTMKDRLPAGSPLTTISETKRYVRELGDNFLGALNVTRPGRTPDFENWIEAIMHIGGKTIWFDYNDTGRNRVYSRKLFTRCHFSEHPAVECAVRRLKELGHACVLYADDCRGEAWRANRFELLRESCLCLDMECFALPPREQAEEADSEGDHIFSEIRRRGATAIVAPRDLTAHRLYLQLVDGGYRIPEDLSLISFDNYAMLQALPVSTVDFGMGYLGYCTFHLLYGAVRISRNPSGCVPARPHIVDRGSLAPARG